MPSYYRVMLGPKSVFAAECFAGGFIGTDFSITRDLTSELHEDWRQFNEQFIPLYIAAHPGKGRISAGLACGSLWTVSKGIQVGDIVLSPDGAGNYGVGEVTGGYSYAPGEILFHRRPVKWLPVSIARTAMSEGLRNAAGLPLTVCALTEHREELEKLIGGIPAPTIVSNDPTVQDPTAFALEEHLEAYLVHNWPKTDLGKEYDIFQVDGEPARQYPTDTGPLDILAISKDKKTLLVIELKKGRASDAVVGQALRYMGYVQEVLAEPGQKVRGIIIALEEDQRIRRALSLVPAIEFYRYELSFKLVKA